VVHVKTEVIRFADTDAAGILYFGSFTTYFDESFLSMLRQHGIGWDEHRTHNFLLPIVEQKTNFFLPLKFGEEVRVYTIISHIGSRSFRSHHILEKAQNEEIVAIGYISRVTVDYDTFRSVKIPEILRSCFETHEFSKSKLKLPHHIYEKLLEALEQEKL
jgi:YbgC/YbaW family acyl-CoA thioester hydrolase